MATRLGLMGTLAATLSMSAVALAQTPPPYSTAQPYPPAQPYPTAQPYPPAQPYPTAQPYPPAPQQPYGPPPYGSQPYGAQPYPPQTAPARPAEPREEERPFAASAGLKVLLGGSVWTAPDDVPDGYEGLGFSGVGGGFGYGAALYAEGRIATYLGLEFDLGYDHTTLRRQVTFDKVVDGDESFVSSGIWFGFLIKGVIPTQFGRFWLGLGPRFMNPSSNEAKLDSQDIPVEAGAVRAKGESSTMLDMALGLVIHADETVEIPIELRAAKNLSQDASWRDRVDVKELDAAGQVTSYEVKAQSSWDFRLGVGIGARF
ncbi:MAG: hypothetical protein KC766_12100 [Myxococcales bacterium]|nr:hypothetical protein [Myxococcales bacterium]